jgi:hypothetical protein
MPGGSFSPASARGLLSALLLGASSIPASSEAVTFADLAGMLIDADIHRSQDVRRDGKSFSIQAHQNWKIAVGADRTIDLTVNTTVNGPRGTQKAPPNAGRFTLDESRSVQSRGGGQGAWSFADGTLSFIRTFPSGAYRAHFEFSRSDAGITCKVTEAFAREVGANAITLESPFGGQVTIINSNQLSSTCQTKSP